MTDQGGILYAMIDIVAVLVLLGALIYGVSMWQKRRRNPATEARAKEAVQRMYHHEEAEAEARAEGRTTAGAPRG